MSVSSLLSSPQRTIEKLAFNPLGYKVAVFGRPNVGKSTLFNRLAGKHLAIVDKHPGVTRDRREADAFIGDLEFRLIDTAGLEEVQKFLVKDKHEYRLINDEPMNADLQKHILQQTENAIEECDVALFVIDAREGVTSLDRHFARWLRRQCRSTRRVVGADGRVTHVTTNKPVVLVANKCDNSEQEHLYVGLHEGFELGFGEPVAFSADHAAGMSGLHNALYASFSSVYEAKVAAFPAREKAINEEIANLANLHEVKLAIVGKVNVGKSTLINTLLGKTRVLTGSQPGVTRDPIEIEWRDTKEEKKEYKKRLQEIRDREEEEALQKSGFNQTTVDATAATPSEPAATPAVPTYRFTLVDTAGLKGVTAHSHSQYSRVDEQSMAASLRSIERSNVVALVVDITEAGLDGMPTTQQNPKQLREEQAKAKRKAERLADTPKPLSEVATSEALSSAPVPLARLNSGELFQPGKKYTEEERGHLLRTFVRNVFSSDDLAIAGKILREGRALLILLNKFDLVPSAQIRDQILEGVALELEHRLNMAGTGVAVVGISGANHYDSMRGQPLKTTIRAAATRCFDRWSARVSTHRLNQWLIEVLKFHPPPTVRPLNNAIGAPRRIALKFIQQVATRPPTFVLFSNRPGEDLPDEYRRFLINALRKEFDLGGVAVRLHVRVRKNPYTDPATRIAARTKAADAAELPSFAAEEEDAAAAAEEEFDESNYSPLDQEVQFDYNMSDATDTVEGREELRREREAARPSRAVVDTPIPRVSPAAATAAISSPAESARRPRVNTSAIFSSARTVRKPRQPTNAAFKWSLHPPRAGSGSAKNVAGARALGGAHGWTPTVPVHTKPFGTKRPKTGKIAKADRNVQSASVLRTVAKVNLRDTARKEAAKNRKLVAKSKATAAKKNR